MKNKQGTGWVRCALIFVWLLSVLVTALPGEDFGKLKERIAEGAWLKNYPLYITPALYLSNLGYDSNIYWYETDSEPDWTADVGIDLGLALVLKDRFILTVNALPYYSFYARNKQEEAFNNRFSSKLYTHLGRFNLDYGFKFDNIRERPNSEFGRRTRRKDREQRFSMEYGSADHLVIGGFVAAQSRRYTEESYFQGNDLSLLNREDTRVGIGLKKRIFTRTQISLNYEYDQYRFPFSPDKDGIGRAAFLRLEFPEISRVRGSLDIGARSFSPNNRLYEDYVKPFGSGKLDIRFHRRLRLQLNYLMDNFFSFYNQDQYFDEKSHGGKLEFYLTRGIKVGGGYRSGDLSYRFLSDGSVNRRDRFRSTEVYVGLRLWRTIGIAVTYSMYHTDSTEPGFSRRSNFIGGNIIYDF